MYLQLLRDIVQNINKKMLAIAFVVLTIIMSIFWIAGHSFLSVAADSGAHIRVYRQGGGYENSFDAQEGTKKLLLSKGNYEVTVTSKNSSYFSIVSTGGFLSDKKVAAVIQPENDRLFVGANAGPCSYYTGALLLSSVCEGEKTLKLHLPANNITPTYTTTLLPTKDNTAIFGDVEGVHVTNTETLVVTKVPSEGEDFGYHTIFSIDNNSGNVTQRKTVSSTSAIAGAHEPIGILAGLGADATYSMSSYKNGFVLYEKYPRSVIYYDTTSLTSPKTINLDQPKKDVDMNSASLSTSDQAIAVYYSAKSEKSTSELVYMNGAVKHFVFSTSFDRAYLCGDVTLCAFKKGVLSVYNISGEEASLIGSIERVNYAASLGDKLLVINNNGAIMYDVQKKSGYFAYTLGGYSFDSATTYKDSFIISVQGYKTGKQSVFVNPKARDETGAIDKQMLELAKNNEIEKISPYGKYVYLSPYLGELKYDEETNTFNYDAAKRKSASQSIGQSIQASGIDNKKYIFINTNP